VILTAGNYVSALIGAVSSIVVARVLGKELFGTYSLVLVVPGLLQLFLGFGVNNAVIRYSAFAISVGKPEDARRYSLHGALFLSITGLGIMAFNLAFAGPLAGVLLHRSDLGSYVELAALSTAGVALMQVVSFTAIGWSRMTLSSTFQAVQAGVKLALSPALVILGFGVAGALWGHIVSLLAAGVLGMFAIYTVGILGRGSKGFLADDLRLMLGFGLPAYVGVLIYNLAINYSTVVLAGIATNSEFGLFSVAQNFLLPVTLVSASLVNGLFPAFASYDGIGGDAKVAFKLAYKFVAFVLTPLVVFLIPAATLLIRILYGAQYAPASQYLSLFALAYIPLAFGYTIHPAFFNGFGRSRLTLIVYAAGAVALVIGAPLFGVTLGLGINGIILATFVSLLASWVAGTLLAARYMGARLDLKANGAIALTALVSYFATAILPPVAHSSVISVLLDSVVFFGIYLTLAPILGAVTSKDVDIMETTFSDLRVINRILGLFFRYVRLMLSLRG
jgi:O-antigen/teichoic acid export membrane protein